MTSQSRVEIRLREREESRKAAIEQKKAEREAGQRQEETSDFYLREFSRKKAAIVGLFDSASDLSKDQLTAHFNQISGELQTLQKFVSDSTLFLTSFDLRNSQQVRTHSCNSLILLLLGTSSPYYTCSTLRGCTTGWPVAFWEPLMLTHICV